ncbi:MAG: HAD family phosphatase [Lachnospiraceae bacterium]|nr:HAD family phosphatase [Lachnospiraceae bacterium]MDY5742709.1 HAD family phosphatase [Lachnospiraceae bacterium]
MREFKGVIMDLDGTVLDSAHVWSRVDEIFLQRRGFAVPDDYMEAISTIGFSRAADYTITRFRLNEEPQAIMAEWLALAGEAYANDVGLKPGVYAYLEHLQRLQIPVAVATSNHPDLYRSALDRNGITRFFSAHTVAAEVKTGKDQPDIYHLAASKLGLAASDCLVFEDIVEAARGAKKAGAAVIGVFDIAVKQHFEMLRQVTDRVIYDFRELIEE